MVSKKQYKEAQRLYKLCASGKAPNHFIKRELVELYNAINGTRYKTDSNCSSCLYTCFRGIKKIAETNYKDLNNG